MPKTNYRECWWLVQAISGDLGPGSYRNGTGYSMRNLNDLRPIGKRIDLFPDKEEGYRIKEKFRQDLMRWRVIIYNEFGLGILQASDPGKFKKKGFGGYYYYLANPELLEQKGKTLKDHIKYLSDNEKHFDDRVPLSKIESRFKGGSSMGFITAGGTSSYGFLSTEGTSYRKILGEENLEIMQFAMQFGEVLTIKYGKIRTGVDINAPYSFEPNQLKEIEGRWYVIGNLYPMGNKELAEIAVYDLARLEFADDENPDVLFEPVKGFDINNKETLTEIYEKNKRYFEGWYFDRIGEVRTIEIITHTQEFAKYLSEHPFCSSQEEFAEGKFRIYIRLTIDLIVMFGAYGAELSFEVKPKEDKITDGLYYNDAEIIQLQLNYFRNTGE